MIELKNLTKRNECCGGLSYHGTAEFQGTTVKEVLEEIKEFSKGVADDIGEGFGTPNKHMGAAWGIYVNDVPYLGDWNGWRNKYRHEYDDEKVLEVKVDGGWYCFYDFRIVSEKTEKSASKLLWME